MLHVNYEYSSLHENLAVLFYRLSIYFKTYSFLGKRYTRFSVDFPPPIYLLACRQLTLKGKFCARTAIWKWIQL